MSGVVFAASILTLIGCFQVIAGLVAIIDDDFYVVTANYTFDLDASVWGWLHLLLGIVLVITGFGLFSRRAWAGVTAIVLAMLSAIENFFFIPYYPFWSIVVIALAVWVIWALTRPGGEREPATAMTDPRPQVELLVPWPTLLKLFVVGAFVALTIVALDVLLSIFVAIVLALGLDSVVAAPSRRSPRGRARRGGHDRVPRPDPAGRRDAGRRRPRARR